MKSTGPADVAILLAYAQRVIIVPGYGLAVAQAQHALRQLVDLLIERGVQVDYAIHPVAGRMPGHMNVLLAEAQVPYEQLKEMDEIDPEFKQVDGAGGWRKRCRQPAAETTPGAPIYGMPILHANQARQVVFMKRSMRPGFAGIENELLYEPTTTCSSVTPRTRWASCSQSSPHRLIALPTQEFAEGRAADSRVRVGKIGAGLVPSEGAADGR